MTPDVVPITMIFIYELRISNGRKWQCRTSVHDVSVICHGFQMADLPIPITRKNPQG